MIKFVAAALALCSMTMATIVWSSGADPEAATFNPQYHTSQGALLAGKAFVVSMAGCPAPVLLSAFHLFGPMGGLARQMMPEELPAGVTTVKLQNIVSTATTFSFPLHSVTPQGTRPCCNQGPMVGVGDVAAFQAPETLRPVALPVSKNQPQRGDHVTLVTSVIGKPNVPTGSRPQSMGCRTGI